MNSNFKFSNPRLTELNYLLDQNFKVNQSRQVEVPLTCSTNVKRHATNNEAYVELTITLGKNDGESPFYIVATEAAFFKWTPDMDFKSDILLTQNAPALLLGYLRPLIATITSMSPYNAYNLPFIDFTKQSK